MQKRTSVPMQRTPFVRQPNQRTRAAGQQAQRQGQAIQDRRRAGRPGLLSRIAKTGIEEAGKLVGKALKPKQRIGPKPERTEYEELLRNPETRKFFGEIGKAMPEIFGTGYFKALDKEEGREIAVMLWKSGFTPKEIRNLFSQLKKQGVRPDQLYLKIEEIAETRMQELKQTGSIQTVFPKAA